MSAGLCELSLVGVHCHTEYVNIHFGIQIVRTVFCNWTFSVNVGFVRSVGDFKTLIEKKDLKNVF